MVQIGITSAIRLAGPKRSPLIGEVFFPQNQNGKGVLVGNGILQDGFQYSDIAGRMLVLHVSNPQNRHSQSNSHTIAR